VGKGARFAVIVFPFVGLEKDAVGKGLQLMRSVDLTIMNCLARAPAGQWIR
jgi:hypothetical protein